MPTCRPPQTQAGQLPAVMTPQELAEFERLDVRTVRAALKAGQVPGAFQRGRSWRIVTASYFAGIGGR